jgi:hypothetical protein
MYVCPQCEQVINQATEICPYCRADLTALPEEVEEPKKKSNIGKAILLWGLALGFLWLMVWIALPLRMMSPAVQSENRALEAMTSVRAALASYASAEGGFPASLETLGNSARAAAQYALSGGYQLQYFPGQIGADGRVHSYSLLARPSNYGFRSFYSDETGAVRSTREGRAATAQDPPVR